MASRNFHKLKTDLIKIVEDQAEIELQRPYNMGTRRNIVQKLYFVHLRLLASYDCLMLSYSFILTLLSNCVCRYFLCLSRNKAVC